MKRAFVAALLAWVAAWPLAQRALVAAFDVNPWKLAGFGMYAAATPPVLVALFRQGETGVALLDERGLPEELRQRLDRFRVERHALGALLRPDALGRAVLAARPDLPWLLVVVQRMRLDPGSGRMTSRRDSYVYERDAL